jgi:hypothetical protein
VVSLNESAHSYTIQFISLVIATAGRVIVFTLRQQSATALHIHYALVFKSGKSKKSLKRDVPVLVLVIPIVSVFEIRDFT